MKHDTFRKEIRMRFEAMADDVRPDKMDYREKSFLISPNVFSPKLFSESLWFANELSQIVGDSSLLEVGTGTGIIALTCAMNGATVEACDINAQAVLNATQNFENYGVLCPTYVSDVFQGIPKERKYDFIFWNHPFNYSHTQEKLILLKSIFDYHYNNLEEYLSQAKEYLSPNGRLLLGTGNLADFDKIDEIARNTGLCRNELLKEKCPIHNDTFPLYCSIQEFHRV